MVLVAKLWKSDLKSLAPGVILVVLVFLVYMPTYPAYFLGDDFTHIYFSMKYNLIGMLDPCCIIRHVDNAVINLTGWQW